jgi:hypothetical protein
MDTFNTGGSSSSGELSALREHQRQLQNLLLATLLALILLAIGVGMFIFKQLRMVQQNLAESRPAVMKMVGDYQRVSEPLIRNFSMALAQFASTNQDFRPILEKYRPALSNYMGAPLPGAGPIPPGR